MDDIIKKLSDIENMARVILDNANMQKTTITMDYNNATLAWDFEKEQETKLKIDECRAHTHSLIQDKLREQEQFFQAQLDSLNDDYESNKTKYLDFLFQQVIGD